MGATPDGVPRPRTGGVHRTSSIYNCVVPFGLWWHLESHAPAYTIPPPHALNHESSPTYVVDFAGLLGSGRVSLVLSLCLGQDGEGARNAGTGADGYGVGDRAGLRDWYYTWYYTWYCSWQIPLLNRSPSDFTS